MILGLGSSVYGLFLWSGISLYRRWGRALRMPHTQNENTLHAPNGEGERETETKAANELARERERVKGRHRGREIALRPAYALHASSSQTLSDDVSCDAESNTATPLFTAASTAMWR
eukprot:2231152-Rhodomonas_salina.1